MGNDQLTIMHTDPHFCADCEYKILVVSTTASRSGFECACVFVCALVRACLYGRVRARV